MTAAYNPRAPQGSHVFIDVFDIGEGDLTVAIKDVVDIAGRPTTLGSAALGGVPLAEKNALIVDRLLGAGMRIVGKTNLHELAFGVTGLNQVYGTPLNTKFPSLIPGGSSSGSAAAVAGGYCGAAIGTDTGGSIRVPAACCGVIGLKPTFGRIPRAGLTPASSSLDCVGPLTRDGMTLHRVMAALDPDWRLFPSRSFRIQWVHCAADSRILDAAHAAARHIDPSLSEVHIDGFDAAHTAGLTIIGAEAHTAYHHLLKTGRVDREVAARLERAGAITTDEKRAALDLRVRFTEEVNRCFEVCDLLALPTLAGFPPTLADATDLHGMLDITRLVRPFNLSGHPALSLPLAPIEGLPVSLQLIARHGEDELLVRAAIQYADHLSKTRISSGEWKC